MKFEITFYNNHIYYFTDEDVNQWYVREEEINQ